MVQWKREKGLGCRARPGRGPAPRARPQPISSSNTTLPEDEPFNHHVFFFPPLEKNDSVPNSHPIVAEVDTESHPSGRAGFSSLQGLTLKTRELGEMNSIPQSMINHFCISAYLLCLLCFKQRSYPRIYNSVDKPVILNRLF